MCVEEGGDEESTMYSRIWGKQHSRLSDTVAWIQNVIVAVQLVGEQCVRKRNNAVREVNRKNT